MRAAPRRAHPRRATPRLTATPRSLEFLAEARSVARRVARGLSQSLHEPASALPVKSRFGTEPKSAISCRARRFPFAEPAELNAGATNPRSTPHRAPAKPARVMRILERRDAVRE